jgi:tripartite-type tricarboxylate transporter receptor subunit TctC
MQMDWTFSRRVAMASIASALVMFTAPISFAQTKMPDGPITMIVGFAPGGLTDNLARLVAQGLEAQIGRPVVVENRPGAAGNLSAGVVAQAPADGSTIYMGAVGLTTTLAVSPKSVITDPVAGLSHIGLVAYTPNVIVASPKLSVSSVKELVAKSKEGKGLTYGSSGIGGGLHLTGEMFAKLTGANMVHIPYTGSARAITDLLGGRLDLQVDNVSGAIQMIKDGRVRALAVTSPERLKELPEVPTMNELGFPGMEVGAWFGLMAPPKVPDDIINKYASELNIVLDRRELRDYFERVGLSSLKTKSPNEFTDYLKQDAALWKSVVQATGVSLDN